MNLAAGSRKRQRLRSLRYHCPDIERGLKSGSISAFARIGSAPGTIVDVLANE